LKVLENIGTLFDMKLLLHRIVILVVCPLLIFGNEQPKHWSELTATELAHTYRILCESHPGYENPYDPEFKPLLDEHYQYCRAKLAEVSTWGGYVNLLKFFVNRLKDPHCKVVFHGGETQVEWPGFIAKCLGHNFYLVDVKGTLPNRRIISWNSEPVSDYIKTKILPYKGGDVAFPNFLEFPLHASRVFAAPYLTLWEENPWISKPMECEVEEEGEAYKICLEWQPIDRKQYLKEAALAIQGKPNSIEISWLSAHEVWVFLPTFAPLNEEVCESLRESARQLGNVQDGDLVILDLRGNRGGNLQWGVDLLKALFGDDYYHQEMGKAYQENNQFILHRISDKNILKKEEIYETFIKHKVNEEQTQSIEKLIFEMKEAKKTGSLYFIEPNRFGLASSSLDSLMPLTARCRPRILVITDSWNTSATTSFLDQLKILTSFEQVGWPTGAETWYTELNSEALPSGLATLYFPQVYYTKRFRLPGECHIPTIFWPSEPKEITPDNQFILKHFR
jgi:hypothetical protein